MAKKTLQPGDRVEWNTSQGKTTGTVKKKLTSEMKIKSHKVAASPENPEYLVESEKSGKPAAHKPDELKKIGKAPGTKLAPAPAKSSPKKPKAAPAKKSKATKK